VLLCTPMTWGGTERLKPFAAAARAIAKEMAVPLVDLNAAHVAHLFANPGATQVSTVDGVHLSAWGNKLTAETLLRGMGLEPKWKQYRVQAVAPYMEGKHPKPGKATFTVEPAREFYAPGEKITITLVPDDGWCLDK
jgi:hypothetical protein